MKELIAEMSLFELGVNVTITGVLIVFTMLVLLVVVLILFGKISECVQNLSAKKAEKARAAVVADMVAHSSNISDKKTNTISEGNDLLTQEVVAVISAAIATMYAGSGKKPVIKAIKKSTGMRSAWANAGIADNTRVF